MNIDFMVYGLAGAGKTTLVTSGASDPRIAPVLMLDYEGGTLAIESHARSVDIEDLCAGNVTPIPDVVDVVTTSMLDDLSRVYYYLGNTQNQPYRTLVLDSLSEMYQLCLLHNTGNWQSAVTSSITKVRLPHIDEYGSSAAQVRTIIRAVRNLPMHRFYVCGLKTETNPTTKMDQAEPNLGGKLSKEVPGLVTFLGLLQVEEAIVEGTDKDGKKIEEIAEVRVLYTKPRPGWVAKDRSEMGKLGGEIEDPTMPKIFDLLGVPMPATPEVQTPKKTNGKKGTVTPDEA